MWEYWRGRLSGNNRSQRTSVGGDGASHTGGHSNTPSRATTVNFKDLTLVGDDSESDDAADYSCEERIHSNRQRHLKKVVKRNKLIIIMVGLPGRGKTFLCNKLVSYLNWLGHTTRHFNVGQYRRVMKDDSEVQNASFFDHANAAGREAREKALLASLVDLISWLEGDEGQVAIFDATNTTEERRQFLISKFHGRFQYMFIESICNDEEVLEQNYRYKMMYSPDYKNVSTEEQALRDFKDRIKYYQAVYEPISDRRHHYIKLIDMVTGRGHLDVNRISGYISGKIVFFLMQICKAGMMQSRKIWLTRHGESEYNRLKLLGGDSALSPKGEEYARCLPDLLFNRLPLTFQDEPVPLSVWTSTLKRTIQTAEHLPFPKMRWKAIDEIDAGVCDGLSYKEVQETMPEEFEARRKDKLKYRYPSGESYLDVIQRLEPVIVEMERERECICVVGHQAILRAIYGYFMKVPLQDIPSIEVPLHTLIELTPMPDGTMSEEKIQLDVRTPPSSPPPVPPVRWFMGTPPIQMPAGAGPLS